VREHPDWLWRAGPTVTPREMVAVMGPTGKLDNRKCIEVTAILQHLNASGATIVTHEPGIAARAARVVLLRDGRATSDKVRARPSLAEATLATWPESAVA
jgi:ABC-type lipoprotein export system ATPase subunit